MLLAGAQERWTQRNEVVQAWEEEIGIKEKKQEAARKGWTRSTSAMQPGAQGETTTGR